MMCSINRAARSGNGSLLPWRPFRFLHPWDMRLACRGFVLSSKTNAFRCFALLEFLNMSSDCQGPR